MEEKPQQGSPPPEVLKPKPASPYEAPSSTLDNERATLAARAKSAILSAFCIFGQSRYSPIYAIVIVPRLVDYFCETSQECGNCRDLSFSVMIILAAVHFAAVNYTGGFRSNENQRAGMHSFLLLAFLIYEFCYSMYYFIAGNAYHWY
ncbi:hypothetical protein ACSS6W_010104 [Trichoderma asperelloides]|nr:hypothetical protein LI328DRAFT_125934 [Trichoderma asperelloides]